MTYRTAPIASSNSPAFDYIRLGLEPDMINVGWVKVSTNVQANSGNASNLWLWNVYKSPGANNTLAKDWYFAYGWDNTSNANVAVTIFEQWNSSSNQCLGYGPSFSMASTPVSGANNYCNVNFSTLPLTPGSNAACWASNVGLALSTFSFTYYQTVTIDRIISVASNTSALNTGFSFYAGMYDSYMNSIQDPYPICFLNFLNASAIPAFGVVANSITGFTTREPSSGGSSNAAACGTYCYGALNFLPGGTNPPSGTPEVYSNRVWSSRIQLGGRGAQAMRGLLKDVYVLCNAPTKGDSFQLVIAGTTYTAVGVHNITLTSNPSGLYGYMLAI